MKKVFLALMGAVALSLAVGLTACGSKSDNADSQQTENVDETSDEATAQSADDNDVNKVLNDYEKFVNSYASVSKQAASGDKAAQAECDSLMTQAQMMSEKLDRLSEKMTPAQATRFAKILDKLNEAVSNITLE